MNLNEFIDAYNKTGVIVLVGGKRAVYPEDEKKIHDLGRLLAEKMNLVHFRSGNAMGTDELFAKGVSSVDPSRMHVVIPDSEHRKKARKGLKAYSLDDMPILNEDKIIYETRKNKKTAHLVDGYLEGVRGKTSHIIAPIFRNSVMVLGQGDLTPATVGVFYLDLADPDAGGTGFTKNLCHLEDVPVIDQRTWFEWVK